MFKAPVDSFGGPLDAQVASTSTWASAVNSASRRARCLSVSKFESGCRVRRGAVDRVVFAAAVAGQILLDWRRQRSSASPTRRTTWKGSMTVVAAGSSSAVTDLNPMNPSIVTISAP